MQTLLEAVQGLTPAQRDLVAFVFIDCRAGRASARFLFAARMPDGQLRPPSQIEAMRLARRSRRGRQPVPVEHREPLTVVLSPTPVMRLQVDELNTSLLLGTLSGTRWPVGTYSTLEVSDARWLLTTHAGSPSERAAWLRGEPVVDMLPRSVDETQRQAQGPGAKAAD